MGAFAYVDRILNQLKGRKMDTYLTLEGGPNGERILPGLLRRLREERYLVRVPLELWL